MCSTRRYKTRPLMLREQMSPFCRVITSYFWSRGVVGGVRGACAPGASSIVGCSTSIRSASLVADGKLNCSPLNSSSSILTSIPSMMPRRLLIGPYCSRPRVVGGITRLGVARRAGAVVGIGGGGRSDPKDSVGNDASNIERCVRL